MSAPEFERVLGEHQAVEDSRGEIKSCRCGLLFGVQHQRNGTHRPHVSAPRNAEVARWAKGLVIPLFDAATKAASPDDWAGHLPNCGYSDDGPACGCADYGRRLLAAIRGTLAALAPTADEKGAGR